MSPSASLSRLGLFFKASLSGTALRCAFYKTTTMPRIYQVLPLLLPAPGIEYVFCNCFVEFVLVGRSNSNNRDSFAILLIVFAHQ